eukprot:1137505-Pelagomonas_calceolata.AAC.4
MIHSALCHRLTQHSATDSLSTLSQIHTALCHGFTRHSAMDSLCTVHDHRLHALQGASRRERKGHMTRCTPFLFSLKPRQRQDVAWACMSGSEQADNE